jgi:hypothetical protein
MPIFEFNKYLYRIDKDRTITKIKDIELNQRDSCEFKNNKCFVYKGTKNIMITRDFELSLAETIIDSSGNNVLPKYWIKESISAQREYNIASEQHWYWLYTLKFILEINEKHYNAKIYVHDEYLKYSSFQDRISRKVFRPYKCRSFRYFRYYGCFQVT